MNVWTGTAIAVCLFWAAAFGAEGKRDYAIRVVDANARPVVGAEVAVYREVWGYGGRQGDLEMQGQISKTGDDGVLQTKLGGKWGNYIIFARKAGLAFGWENQESWAFRQNVTIMLGKPYVMGGQVVDEKGMPIDGAMVGMCLAGDKSTKIFSNPKEWFNTKTDSQGRFAFKDIPEYAMGDFRAESPGKAVTLTCNELGSIPGWQFAPGATDVRIVLPAEARIEGRVVDDQGKGAAGVELQAKSEDRYSDYFSLEPAVSDHDGYFSFKGLGGTSYNLQVWSKEGTAEMVGDGVNVVTKAGETTKGIIIKVGKGGIVELNVLDAESKKPILGMWCSVWQKSDVNKRSGFDTFGITGADGRTKVRVPSGQYHIHTYGRMINYAEPDSSIVDVAEGKTSQLEILVDHDPFIRGTVKDESGKMVAGAMVGVSYCGVETDSKGEFEVSWTDYGGTPQKYVMAHREKDNLAGIAEIKDKAKPVDIVLKSGMKLAGQITDMDGKAVPVAQVMLTGTFSNTVKMIGSEEITDANGHYEICAIPRMPEEIQYRIKIDATGYGPIYYQKITLKEASVDRYEDMNFELKPANMSVSGFVMDANDKPVEGVEFFLHGSGQPRRRGVTNGKGEFTIGRICEGPLQIQAGMDGEGTKAGFVEAQGGDKDVKIVLGKTIAHENYISLVGKELPTLGEMGLKVEPNEIAGKAIVVYFFDMQQRSSRHFVGELAKRAEELKQKGVAVMGVQMGKVDENALAEWAKKTSINFPIGTIPENADKAKLKYGVKSLPWLVLTDDKHVVKAEGLSLSELDEKLKSAAKAM